MRVYYRRIHTAREKIMNNTELLKGLGLGIALGCTISMAMSSGKRKRKKCKHHTIRAVGDVVDNVTDMFGL